MIISSNSKPNLQGIDPKPKQYYAALTGIRAVAAYMVFLHHFNPFRVKDISTNFMGTVFQEFHIGVTIFFTLSGFLITARYLDRIKLTKQWAWNYFRSRLARIYPLYFLLTILTFIVMYFNLQHDHAHVWEKYSATGKALIPLFNLSFIRGFFSDIKSSGIAQGWSLTVEECFYISAPFLLLGLSINRKYIFLYPMFVLLPGVLLVAFIGSPDRFSGFFSSYRFLFNYTYFGRCFEFICGMGLAIVLNKANNPNKKYDSISFTFFGFSFIVVCILILAQLQSSLDNSGWINPCSIFVNNIILPVGIIMVFYGLIKERTWASSILKSRLFDLLGKSSYAFYLVHMGIFSVAIQQNVSKNYFIIFIFTNIIAILLYNFVEKPAQVFLTTRPK